MEAIEFREPYRHWVLRDAVPALMITQARLSIPEADHPMWIRYDNELERRKWAMEDRRAVGPAWVRLLDLMEGLFPQLSKLVGVELSVDPDRRGAGLHMILPGGYLNCHLDYAMHPCGLERRVNLILFLDEPTPQRGGGLQLCDPMGEALKTLYPAAGEAVVWECGDTSYHAVEPLAADSNPRVTAAAYYLAKRRPGCVRRRALYMPRR